MMKKKVKIFDIVLIVIFTVFSLVMIIPVYKVLVDSFDLKTAYGMKLFPEQFLSLIHILALDNRTIIKKLPTTPRKITNRDSNCSPFPGAFR